MKGLRFDDSYDSSFHASKISNMCSAVLFGGRSADIQEFCFQAAKFQIWTLPKCKGVYLLIVRNSIFRLRNVELLAVLSSNEVDF